MQENTFPACIFISKQGKYSLACFICQYLCNLPRFFIFHIQHDVVICHFLKICFASLLKERVFINKAIGSNQIEVTFNSVYNITSETSIQAEGIYLISDNTK